MHIKIIWEYFQKYWYLNSTSSVNGLGWRLSSVLFNIFDSDSVMQERLKMIEAEQGRVSSSYELRALLQSNSSEDLKTGNLWEKITN